MDTELPLRHDVARIALRAAREHVDKAAAVADRKPTDARKQAGNYRKGHLVLHGLPVTIETPKGARRSGTGPDGKPWSVTMPAHYGYVKRTTGADGDHVDCYIGPHPLSQAVFIVDQADERTGRFDEHKVMLGFQDGDAATEAYMRAFSDGKGGRRLAAMTKMTIGQFKRWLARGDTTKPVGH